MVTENVISTFSRGRYAVLSVTAVTLTNFGSKVVFVVIGNEVYCEVAFVDVKVVVGTILFEQLERKLLVLVI